MKVFLSFFLLLIYLTHAQETFPQVNIFPIKKIDAIGNEPVPEATSRLSKAQVAIADYDLLKRDFPFLQGLSENQIDEWILDQAGYISEAQTAKTNLNSEIPHENSSRQGYRPKRYGRALIYEALDLEGEVSGLIDAKGAGLAANRFGVDRGKTNGLLSLGEGIREFNYEKLMSQVVGHAGVDASVVGSYAVIDAGFEVLHQDGSSSRAGLYLRQAHARSFSDFPDIAFRLRMEDLFNHYGIFTNGNIQHTTSREIYDFGHYLVKNDLEKLNPQLAVSNRLWGYDPGNLVQPEDDVFFFSKRDRPWIWSHDTAKAFAEGSAGKNHVRAHYKNMLEPVAEKLSRAEPPFELVKSLGLGFSKRSCFELFKLK